MPQEHAKIKYSSELVFNQYSCCKFWIDLVNLAVFIWFCFTNHNICLSRAAQSVCDGTSCSDEDVDEKASIQDSSAPRDDSIHTEEQLEDEKANEFMDSNMVEEKNKGKETEEKRSEEKRLSPQPHEGIDDTAIC